MTSPTSAAGLTAEQQMRIQLSWEAGAIVREAESKHRAEMQQAGAEIESLRAALTAREAELAEVRRERDDWKRSFETANEIIARVVDRVVDEAVKRIDDMRAVGQNDEALIASGANRLSDDHVRGYAHAIEMAVMVVEFMKTPEFMRERLRLPAPPSSATTSEEQKS